ncbi:MAG: M1 family metallopeptidase [Bacteroidetes bacterium]|nr:M1 family metallopeptidase [Bacteroidota bacterium]
MKKVLFFSFSLFLFLFSSAQEKNYFQQEVHYKINVSLDDKKNDLNADESLEYINNSPDELTFIWFHIWPNGYKNNNTPLAKQLIEEGNTKFYFATKEERGWIDGLDFKVNGQPVKTETGQSIDIVKIILNEPLKSGGKIFITTPFHVHIPLGVFSRLGHIGQQYQITQWYPKPSVYDKYGWHPIPYLNQGEFYSEFGSFDVSITLPKNYVVGATGTLVNGEEETAWLMAKAEETKAILSYNPHDTSFPVSSSETKTLRYTASTVHDFGWFADKRYHVLHDEVTLPHSQKKVDTWVMFTNLYGKYWEKAAKYVSDAVYYYSLWNGDYPYPHATAVDGALSAGGGMEYPMITVIGAANDDATLDRVIAHEVGHNWFYGILGSNERDHAWMDEGINSFNENRYMQTKYPKDSVKMSMQTKVRGKNVDIGKLLGLADLDESALFDLAYRFNAVQKKDQPVDLTSAEYTTVNYGTVVYGKTAVILAYLQAYLGTEMYDKCAQAYFEKWKFHHPYPPDIKKAYEEVSGKDLNWFFDEIIPTTKQIDYKISSARKTDDKNLEIKVKNKGKINSPLSISEIKNGKIIFTQWHEGFAGKKIISFTPPSGEMKEALKIDAENKIPDINRQNNTYKMHGLCKKTEPLQLKMLGFVHNTDKTQLFWAPVAGWNNYNKFMAGALIYNNFIPEKKFEWQLMPMYGFGNKDLAGGASVHYNMHFNKIFQTVRIGGKGEQYCYLNDADPYSNLKFRKIAPEISFEIKKKHLRNTLKQTINFSQVNIFRDEVYSDNTVHSLWYQFHDITYLIDNSRKMNPYNIAFNYLQGERIAKTSVTANYKMNFKKKGKGLDVRFFAGDFLYDRNPINGNYFFYASGATGAHDYLYDYVFLGRSETDGLLSHQFAETEGAMKVYTPLGRSKTWLASLNLKCSLPGKLPLKLFSDFTMLPPDAALNQTMLFDAGIYLPLMKGIVEIYLPLLVSKDIKDVFELNNPDVKGFNENLHMIRFTFNIQKMNPFELVRNIDL